MEIVIRFAGGKFQFQTNVPDQVVLLGMLEMAKAAALRQQQAAPAVQAPPPELARHLLAPTG